MKKIIIAILPVLLLAACTKDISRFNEETKKPAAIPAGTLFTNAVKNVTDGLASPRVTVNVFRFTVKHWAMSVYQDEAQYDFSTRAIPQAWWARMYSDALIDLKEASRLITSDATIIPAVKANQLAILDITQVYIYSILVNTFGDVPYSEALNANNLFPKYDDAKTIYTDLLKRLKTALTSLNDANGGFTATEDVIYKGNTAKWIKFGNSLLLKLGMIIADEDAAASKAAVETADAQVFGSAADNAVFTYLDASPNNNPLFTEIVLSGRSDYVAAKDLMDVLVANADPRKTKYFGTNNAGNYAGGVVGLPSTFSDVSKPGALVAAPGAPCPLLDYVETEFYRAEAKERGYNVAGTAEEHYNNAIRASILYWGGTAAEAAAYLANPAVAYATAAGSWKQKIGIQKWIGLYNRPFDGWIELRRMDYPVLSLPVGAKSGFPNRLTYPGNEQQLNGVNYAAAAAKIGGDKVETKIFWDKN